MLLRIAPFRLIRDIQSEFNELFGFLKLEFFQNELYQKPFFTNHQFIPTHKTLHHIQGFFRDGYITVMPAMRVKELEKKFSDDFSLNVQVFRRSGNVWLQTTMTDNWTLQQQNDHGMELSEINKSQVIVPIVDFDLNRDADH